MFQQTQGSLPGSLDFFQSGHLLQSRRDYVQVPLLYINNNFTVKLLCRQVSILVAIIVFTEMKRLMIFLFTILQQLDLVGTEGL